MHASSTIEVLSRQRARKSNRRCRLRLPFYQGIKSRLVLGADMI